MEMNRCENETSGGASEKNVEENDQTSVSGMLGVEIKLRGKKTSSVSSDPVINQSGKDKTQKGTSEDRVGTKTTNKSISSSALVDEAKDKTEVAAKCQFCGMRHRNNCGFKFRHPDWNCSGLAWIESPNGKKCWERRDHRLRWNMRADGSPWSILKRSKDTYRKPVETKQSDLEQLPRSCGWAGNRKNMGVIDQKMRDNVSKEAKRDLNDEKDGHQALQQFRSEVIEEIGKLRTEQAAFNMEKNQEKLKVMEESKRDWNDEKNEWMKSLQSFRSEFMEEIVKLRSEQTALELQVEMELRDEMGKCLKGYSDTQKRVFEAFSNGIKEELSKITSSVREHIACVVASLGVLQKRLEALQEKDMVLLKDGIGELRSKCFELDQHRMTGFDRWCSLQTSIESLGQTVGDILVEGQNEVKGTDESESEGETYRDYDMAPLVDFCKKDRAESLKARRREKWSMEDSRKALLERNRNGKTVRAPLRKPNVNVGQR